jgi:hypothetical protein
MDVSKIIGSIPLAAGAVYVTKELFVSARDKVKKWDKHVADDETTHAVFKTKLEAQAESLKNIESNLNRLVDKLL